ncbi:Fc.00g001640.m01.CDS01 [Cosmosporella sp. VM-42]
MDSPRHRPVSFLLLLFLFFYNIRYAYASASTNAENNLEYLPRALTRREATVAEAGQGDFTCGPGKPCSNGACCGTDGWCGYGPTYCGDGCQSNCNATAECGRYASTAGKECPLNVCCSEFGFCGTTTDFCKHKCQSNCGQPKPSGSPSNSQKRIVGYWEAWNGQHPCGTMGTGEIPVHLLTHLNIAFGYISHDFQITNMDGIDSDIYKNIGNVKSRNPNLKITIALGGWTFSDPGPWQSVFPDLCSSQANRAIFITNLLGFLSEYGYDGVDFDWEYPGADDRGGSYADAENYVALLKELRAAIDANGRDYIVTFTAPTSYWYLRHFDIKNMEQHVDWISLMSYDLHGVWDGDNPIGSQVLAHTNLTEIDLALDLFWRIGVEPSNIVLGMGFYGRSFALVDASCWKPGCAFSGPGAAGPCTNTEGILSYREIKDILTNTGTTAYLDEAAAVRYLVYDDNSWISFDDASTFKSKIEYANKIGLSGLMVWAVDLDDSGLSALSAISDSGQLDKIDMPFTLVDIKKLFPKENLPPQNTVPSYGLVNFGDRRTQLRKRDGEPDPFVFLDCPEDVVDLPSNETQKARVVCLSDDVEGCFRVMERGVEGTLVEMPDNCAPNTFARAISIEISTDQEVPATIGKRSPTSEVFEFTFDFDMSLLRRDTNNTSIRMDYSNVRGYWDSVVDSPGIQSRDLGNLDKRYFAPLNANWRELFENAESFQWEPEDAQKIQKDIKAPLYWETVDDCPIDGGAYGEGIGAYVAGNMDAEFWFGFSMIATMDNDEPKVLQANGFLKVKGQSDLTFGIGGMGDIDIAKAYKSNPAFTTGGYTNLEGNMINAGNLPGFLRVAPYYQVQHQMATLNGVGRNNFQNSSAALNGLLRARVVTDFGDFTSVFPDPDRSKVNDDREQNKIEILEDNVLYGSYGDGGTVAIGTYLKFGLKLTLLESYMPSIEFALPDISLVYNTMTEFSFYPGDTEHTGTSCSDYRVLTNIYQTADNADTAGWESFGEDALAYDEQTPSDGSVCDTDADAIDVRRSKVVESVAKIGRDLNTHRAFHSARIPRTTQDDFDGKALAPRQGKHVLGGWDLPPNKRRKPEDFLADQAGMFIDKALNFRCETGCVSCAVDEDSNTCCGCICMDCIYKYTDIEDCGEACNPDDGDWPGAVASSASTRRWYQADDDTTILPLDTGGSAEVDQSADDANNNDTYHQLQKRVSGKATLSHKKVSICKGKYDAGLEYRYPAFPADSSFPWDGIENGQWDTISRYWGNATGDCADWAVAKLQPADTANVGGGVTVRWKYNTEHVFEGQLIGDFFDRWLVEGKLYNQLPAPANPTQKLNCKWAQDWILISDPTYPWKQGGGDVAFIQLLLSELGNMERLDRLTIYQARPNMKKGTMFTGKQPTTLSKFRRMGNEAQIQSVKEMGMVFTYLDDKEVWEAFCGTYEAIYDLFGDFDTWYATNSGAQTIPSLQEEWKDYIREVLDSLVRRSRATFDTLYSYRKARTPADQPFYSKWAIVRAQYMRQIQVVRTCKNMDASTV